MCIKIEHKNVKIYTLFLYLICFMRLFGTLYVMKKYLKVGQNGLKWGGFYSNCLVLYSYHTYD
jgi:hypothetical protein